MIVKLISGTMETTSSMDGWIITSQQAVAEGSEDMLLVIGDRIDTNGNVYRDDELIGNVA